jgi:dCMP deaminase
MMRMAYEMAASGSDDPSTQNAAVVVPEADLPYYIVSANRLPGAVERTPRRLERPAKYKYMIHAEEGCILIAAKQGVTVLGGTMVCPWACCLPCARKIVDVGIRRLIVHKERHDVPSDWDDEIREAWMLLNEGGVEIRQWSGRVGTRPILVGGKEWEP